MTAVLLRRRRLGKGSTTGVIAAMQQTAVAVRNWRDHIPEGTRLIFRWGCTSNVGVVGIGHQYEIVNTAASIHWCSDKRQSRLDMQEAGVSVPETYTVEQFFPHNYENNTCAWVVRPSTHAQGRNLLVLQAGANTEYAALPAVYRGGYISELINKVAEYRVFVCQNRVAWVAKKTPGNPEQVAWNVAQGGRFDNVRWSDWPETVIKEALKAANVSETDFCGVDVMVDRDGKAYVLEVNSAPSQTSEYRQKCVAKCFDYIIQNGKQHFPAPISSNWKDIIHPALREE